MDNDEDVEEVVMEDELSQIPDPRHRRSSSTTAPLPPPNFNPPADSPVLKLDTISPPDPLPQSTDESGDLAGSTQSSSSSGTARPPLRTLQSQDSAQTPQSLASDASSASARSEGGQHLVEARNSLRSEPISASTSRSNSTSTPPVEASTSDFELNVINPTPPLQPEDSIEAGPSETKSPEDSGESAWDSVWPAPGIPHRPSIPPDPGRPNFPIAPVSPFITPSFSPAFLPSAPSRLPSSPVTPNGESASPTRRSHSPNRLRQGSRDARSPQMDPQYPEGFQLGRRGSLSSYVPILSHSPPGSMPVSINKHSRSYSGSFHNSTPRSSKSSGTSPPSSPQSSPPKRQLHLQSPTQPDSAYISSPLAPPSRRSSRPSSSDGNVAKAGVIRARRKSVSAIVPESRPEQPVPSLEELPASLPPMTLPPPVTPAPPLDLAPGDDGIPIMKPAQSQTSPTSVLLSPSVRPSMARRALSDYDSQHRSTIPSLHRSSTVPAELDKSPTKRPADAESSSPVSPSRSTDSDMSRSRKSPRRSPSLLPQVSSPEQEKKAPTWKGEDQGQTEYAGDVALVDEGDVLPNVDFQMDVTFDDEGLDTLERIFLLSKSDFPFHRAYVARVLGDLLFDVDPCESVEYVLPLLSGFSLDEDESVKEAFASELHRILWYFFSTCQLNEEEEEAVVTVTSEGLNVVPVKPEEGIESELLQIQEERRQSILSSLGPSSGKTAVSTSAQTPQVIATPASEANTESTVFSPAAQLDLYSADMNPEKRAAYGGGPLVERPVIAVSFFTPLLGSLLLNPNPTVSDSVRHGLVNLVGRIRDKTDLIPEVWGKGANSADITGTKVFVSQTGSHTHQIKTFGPKARKLVEDELVHGIVVGMGQLSTEMPEGLFAEDLEDGQKAIEHYADIHNGSQSGSMTSQVEQFREQLVAEATAGRATSMNLIGSLCDFYSGEEAVENGFVHEVLRSGDGDVPVRAEGAVAISFLAKTVPVEWIYEFIPLVESYLFDPVEHVRQSICLALPAMCKRIEAIDYRRQFAVKAVSSLAQSGDNVRCAVLEMLGEIIHVFHNDPEGPPPELLEVYTADYGDFGLDGDWDVVAAFNFPGVCLTLGSDRWDELRGLYERLQTRAGDKIMRILAASLHELAKILKPGQVERDLLEVYRRCLVCNDEIRERVYEHVHEFLLAVEPATGWSLFKDLLAAWADGSLGGWRAREQLTLHLPSFSESFNTDEQGKCVLEMIKWGLLDPFAAVRNAVSQSIPKIYVVLGHDSPTATGFRELLVDLGTSSSYRQRLTFVRCLREFVRPPPNRSAFEEFFIPHLPRLSQDVVDIRLGLAQMLAGLFVVGAYYGHDAETIPPIIIQVARALAEDEAVDVRDTIRNVDVDRISKGKGIPHRISIPPPPDRAERPDHPTPLAQPLDNAIGRSGIIAPLKHTPTRRPSAEVANQLNSMNLATHNKLNEQSPPQTSDPFDASFAEAS